MIEDVANWSTGISLPVGVEGDVEHAALTETSGGRGAFQRRAQAAVCFNKPDTAGPLADQHAAVGQECEAPGMFKAIGKCLDIEGVFFGFEALRGCLSG